MRRWLPSCTADGSIDWLLVQATVLHVLTLRLLPYPSQSLLVFCHSGIWYTEHCGLFVARTALCFVILYRRLLPKVDRSSIISLVFIKMKNWHIHSVTVQSQVCLAGREKDKKFLYSHSFYMTSRKKSSWADRLGTKEKYSNALEIRPEAYVWPEYFCWNSYKTVCPLEECCSDLLLTQKRDVLVQQFQLWKKYVFTYIMNLKDIVKCIFCVKLLT